MAAQTPLLITVLTLVAIIAIALAVAVTAGVLSRMAGAPIAGAILRAGTAFGATVALLLSVAVATGLI